MLHWVRDSAEVIRRAGLDPLVFYIGSDGEAVRRALEGIPLMDHGTLPAKSVSECFAAMDVYLAPFVDGVSTRRTSLMTGLQHGIATVGTIGHNTDQIFREEHGESLLLASTNAPEDFIKCVYRLSEDARLRGSLGYSGQQLYQREFDWPIVAHRLLEKLSVS